MIEKRINKRTPSYRTSSRAYRDPRIHQGGGPQCMALRPPQWSLWLEAILWGSMLRSEINGDSGTVLLGSNAYRLLYRTCPQRSVPTPKARHHNHCSTVRGAVENQRPPNWTIRIWKICVFHETEMLQDLKKYLEKSVPERWRCRSRWNSRWG